MVYTVYTDGGPDQCVNYPSANLPYSLLMILIGLIAVRTSLRNTWKNPVEHVMLELNLALQEQGWYHTWRNNLAL